MQFVDDPPIPVQGCTCLCAHVVKNRFSPWSPGWLILLLCSGLSLSCWDYSCPITLAQSLSFPCLIYCMQHFLEAIF